MKIEHSIEIDAPARVVWDVFADVERWPEWTASVRSVRPLDGPGLEVGKRFAIEQPRLPRVEWHVTELVPGASWSWRHQSPGATSVASHEVVPMEPDRTLARLRIEQRGPIGAVFGALTARLTRRYLDLEGRGLKARAEQHGRRDAAPS